VIVIEFLDDTVKTIEKIEKRLGVPGLATVEMLEHVDHRRDGLVTLLKPRSPASEAFRVLRTNLQFATMDHDAGRLVITSANPGEGKTTTAVNLAVALAQSGRTVVLVDSDLRRPSVHTFFGMTNTMGFTSLLLDPTLPISEALQPVAQVEGLSILTSGPLPPNPAEVLESARTEAILAELAEQADIVICDSPPLLAVADSAILARRADATVLVFDSGATRMGAAKKAVDTLAKVGVSPIGAVVNKLERGRVGAYYYYYAYRSKYSGYYGDDDISRRKPGAGGGAEPALERLRRGLTGAIARLQASGRGPLS
jgi:capsular exopolysaccharide synthesis family protein